MQQPAINLVDSIDLLHLVMALVDYLDCNEMEDNDPLDNTSRFLTQCRTCFGDQRRNCSVMLRHVLIFRGFTFAFILWIIRCTTSMLFYIPRSFYYCGFTQVITIEIICFFNIVRAG